VLENKETKLQDLIIWGWKTKKKTEGLENFILRNKEEK
jgi:hypothetical protein